MTKKCFKAFIACRCFNIDVFFSPLKSTNVKQFYLVTIINYFLGKSEFKKVTKVPVSKRIEPEKRRKNNQ